MPGVDQGGRGGRRQLREPYLADTRRRGPGQQVLGRLDGPVEGGSEHGWAAEGVRLRVVKDSGPPAPHDGG